jgi:hypothetical protein
MAEPVIPFAAGLDGTPIGMRGDAPHMLIAGGCGPAPSRMAREIAARAGSLGMDVRFCDPRPGQGDDLRGLPGITVADGLPGAAGLIGSTWHEARRRYARLESLEAAAGDISPIVLIVNEFAATQLLLVRDHPALRQISLLLATGRAAAAYVLLAGAGRAVPGLPADFLVEACGTRAALSPLPGHEAQRLFGRSGACTGTTPGTCVALTPAAGLRRALVPWAALTA